MTNTYLPFYFEWAEILESLSDDDYGKLIKSILAFSMGKTEKKKLSPEGEVAYRFITAAITRSEANRANGQKGGIAKAEKQRKAGASPTKCNNSEGNKDKSPTHHKESVKSEGNLPTYSKSGESKDKKSFPTRDQVREFFKKRNFKSNPDEFFNFYDSNGWKVGQNSMQNWYSAAENWELRVKREKTAAKSEEIPHRHGDFDIHEAFNLAIQRSYSDLDDTD